MVKANIERVRFWCFKVLPLVYDDSLSYYEVLCKVVAKLNEMIDSMNELNDTVVDIQAAIAQLQEWVRNVDTTYISQWISEHLANMIFVEINDDGYFVIYIPESWQDITFNTSGWDIVLDPPRDYGHLVLSY
jgi:hypothetical protein